MIYKHYKGGLYRVLFQAQDATNARNRDSMMVYVSLTTGNIYVRNMVEFYEPVVWPCGTKKARFVMELAMP